MNLKKLSDTRMRFAIIIVIAIFLRIINIVSEQIWADEATSIFIAKSSPEEFWRLVIIDIHPPLYYIILKGWIFIFGYSILSCRFLSVIFSVLTLLILYLIGQEIKDDKLGLIITFIYSISPFSIYYANEIRSYSLLHLLFTLGFYFAIKCIKTPNEYKNYFILGTVGIFLAYTHYMGILYYGILIFGLFIFNRKVNYFYKNIILSNLIVFLSYIPWLPYAIDDSFHGPPGYAGGSLNIIYLFYWGFYYFLSPVPSNINNPYIMNLIIYTFLINIPLICFSILSCISFLSSSKFQYYSELKKILSFLILSTLLLFGITIIMGVIIVNSFTAKNLIGGLTLIYIFQGLGLYYIYFNINSFKKNSKKIMRILDPNLLKKIFKPVLIALLITNLIIFPIFKAMYLQKPDWDGCIKRLKKDCNSNDIIIMGYDGGGYSYVMEYYSEQNDFDLEDNFYKLSYTDDDIKEFMEEILKDNITRIWIVDFWQNYRDPDEKTEDMLVDEYDLEEVNEYEFRTDITLTLYKIPES